MTVTYFPFICHEAEEEEEGKKEKNWEDEAVCATQICKCRNPSAMFLFGFYLSTWSCWREKSTSYSAWCSRSPLPAKRASALSVFALHSDTFIALPRAWVCVCVCVAPNGDKHSCPQVIGLNILSVTLQRCSQVAFNSMRHERDILRQLYGLYLSSNSPCIQQ